MDKKFSDQKDDKISYREFNRLLKEQKVPHPSEDSPGDTGEDEFREVELGKDYPEALEEDPSDIVLADTPSRSESDEGDLDDTEERVRDPYGVRSSERPDPEADMDPDTPSTH